MPPKPHPAVPLHLEGTTLEGGGQLLRLSLGLSALTKQPITITNIRGKRSGGGGLKAQHLTCVQWLGRACSAHLSSVGLKSKEITFSPSQDTAPLTIDEVGREIRIMQNTPGSINLVLQAILPFLVFSGGEDPVCVRISGGTNVSNSPSYEYVVEVLIPMLERIGIPRIEAVLHSRGWAHGSTSVGSATFTTTPLTSKLRAFSLTERGGIKAVKAIVIAPRDTERDFRDELESMFDKRAAWIFGADKLDFETEVTFEHSHHEKRYYLLLVATSSTGVKLSRDWLYDQAIRPGKIERIPHTMVKRVSDDLLSELAHGGCVDEHLRDQLVVFQALAEGRSTVDGGRKTIPNEGELIQPSLHARTAMWVTNKLLGIDFNEEGSCNGIGFDPSASSTSSSSEEDLQNLVENIQDLNISTS